MHYIMGYGNTFRNIASPACSPLRIKGSSELSRKLRCRHVRTLSDFRGRSRVAGESVSQTRTIGLLAKCADVERWVAVRPLLSQRSEARAVDVPRTQPAAVLMSSRLSSAPTPIASRTWAGIVTCALE